jgi:hypothetical protein
VRTPLVSLALLLAASVGLAAPPVDVPPEVSGEVGDFIAIRAKTDGKVVKFVPLDPGLKVFPQDLLADKKATVVTAARPGKYRVLCYSSVKDDPTDPAVVVVVVGGVAPDPKPVDPPVPPDPPPAPAKSFRVVLIFESGDALTPAQRGVVYGKAVEDFLNANCTGGKNGWRRRDRDAPGENDPTMAALWAAVKPAVTATPCIAIERDGKVFILPLEPTPAKMIEVLRRYREGK